MRASASKHAARATDGQFGFRTAAAPFHSVPGRNRRISLALCTPVLECSDVASATAFHCEE